MNVWGICMVKDEADIIGWTLPRMAAQLDGVIVADNMSTDGTARAIVQAVRLHQDVQLVLDTEVAYLQSEKMTRLACMARDNGADWVVPFDADEVWYSPHGPIRDVLGKVEVPVAEATLYDHVVSCRDHISNLDPVARIGFRRPSPGALPKVACRVLPGLVIAQGNHGAHYPQPVFHAPGQLYVRHYPYRSVEQMVRKVRNGAAAYAAADDRLPESTGRHWRDYGRFLDRGGEDAIAEIFQTWFYADEEKLDQVVHDPCPVAFP